MNKFNEILEASYLLIIMVLCITAGFTMVLM